MHEMLEDIRLFWRTERTAALLLFASILGLLLAGTAGVTFLLDGNILAFAVSDALPGGNLEMIGYILMAAGLVTAIVSAMAMNRARTTVARRTTTVEGGRDPLGRI